MECEPYLTADHGVMLERPDELLAGVELLCRALSVDKAFIGIENNKPDAIRLLGEKAAAHKGVSIEVVPLKIQYPQGGEKQLIDAVVGRQVPSGAPPYRYRRGSTERRHGIGSIRGGSKRKPLFERVVTVTGKPLRLSA